MLDILPEEGAEAREAYSAGVIFIDRLFTHEKVLSSVDRNKILDDLEAKFIEKFTKAFKKYLRLDIIPKELVEVLREVLLDIRSHLYKIIFTTPLGTVGLWESYLIDDLKTYRGIKGEEAKNYCHTLLVVGLQYMECTALSTQFLLHVLWMR